MPTMRLMTQRITEPIARTFTPGRHEAVRGQAPHPLLMLQQAVGNEATQRVLKGKGLWTKLAVGTPGDAFEQEADRVAGEVTRVAPGQVAQRRCACGGVPGLDGECAACRTKRLEQQGQSSVQTGKLSIPPILCDVLQTKRAQANVAGESLAPPIVDETLRSPGQPLDAPTRALFEPHFGFDFSSVRIHTDEKAAESAGAINALAYTLGQHVVFGTGQYAPRTSPGIRLLAHELTHVVQQSSAGADREQKQAHSLVQEPHIQRTLGDGHDLTSPRFSRLLDLEAAYDGETVISIGDSGRSVQAIQQAVYDLGFPLPTRGADGKFGGETETAVKAFQAANPPLVVDGKVGKHTMAALDARFSAPALPAAATLSALWTPACVRSVLCPWSPHTVDVLSSRITLKSFDSISWADEKWDGAAWVPAPFPGAGYNTGTEIGVLNQSCQKMSETLYHEVLHAEQPTTHTTTLKKESYAYRIGEEFSIAMGFAGRPSLRSVGASGREFADPAKAGAFVSTAYPSVPSGGGGEQIIDKGVVLGEVLVRRPDGSLYTRSAAIGEKVPGPMTVVNEVTHPIAGWTCP